MNYTFSFMPIGGYKEICNVNFGNGLSWKTNTIWHLP